MSCRSLAASWHCSRFCTVFSRIGLLLVAAAPTIVGAGTEAIGDLGISTGASGLRLTNRSLHVMADDLLIAWDVAGDWVVA